MKALAVVLPYSPLSSTGRGDLFFAEVEPFREVTQNEGEEHFFILVLPGGIRRAKTRMSM